jgi:hypothetical protein
MIIQFLRKRRNVQKCVSFNTWEPCELSVVIGYELADRGSIPGRDWYLSHCHHGQTVPGVHPTSCIMGTLLTYLLIYLLSGAEYYLKTDCHSTYQQISCFLHGIRRFITVFIKNRHWTLSWASWIQFAPSIPISLRSNLMLSSHLRLGPPNQNPVNTFLFPHACHMSCPPHPPWFNHPNIRWRIQAMKFIIYNAYQELFPRDKADGAWIWLPPYSIEFKNASSCSLNCHIH